MNSMLPPPWPDVLILDLDGTLVDSSDAIVDGVLAQAEVEGLTIPSREWAAGRIGFPPEDTWRLMGAPDPAATLERFRERWMPKIPALSRALPGAAATLVAMCELGHRCAIATTRRTDSAIDTLRATGLLEFVDPIVGADQVRAPKPAPDTLLAVLKATGCAPRDALMIGDTEVDVLAAVSAKVRCWAVLGGVGSETPLRDAGAERILGTGIGGLLGALQTVRHTTGRHPTGDRPE